MQHLLHMCFLLISSFFLFFSSWSCLKLSLCVCAWQVWHPHSGRAGASTGGYADKVKLPSCVRLKLRRVTVLCSAFLTTATFWYRISSSRSNPTLARCGGNPAADLSSVLNVNSRPPLLRSSELCVWLDTQVLPGTSCFENFRTVLVSGVIWLRAIMRSEVLPLRRWFQSEITAADALLYPLNWGHISTH